MSYRHPSRFLLVGTMNPEEGELRPQLLDRFGLACRDLRGAGRWVPEVDRGACAAFEGEDAGFREEWDRKDEGRRGAAALPRVGVPGEILESIVAVVAELGVAGHRGDITVLKAAKALAAIKGIPSPDDECLSDGLALHRLKEDPFDRRLRRERSRRGAVPVRLVLPLSVPEGAVAVQFRRVALDIDHRGAVDRVHPPTRKRFPSD